MEFSSLTTESSGSHRLGELQHSGGLALRRGPADDELLVDLFHEGDKLIIAFKGGARIGPHAGDGGGGVQVGGPGPLGRGHDFSAPGPPQSPRHPQGN